MRIKQMIGVGTILLIPSISFAQNLDNPNNDVVEVETAPIVTEGALSKEILSTETANLSKEDNEHPLVLSINPEAEKKPKVHSIVQVSNDSHSARTITNISKHNPMELEVQNNKGSTNISVSKDVHLTDRLEVKETFQIHDISQHDLVIKRINDIINQNDKNRFDLKIHSERFQDKSEKAKKYAFVANECGIFDKNPQYYNSLETIAKTYGLLSSEYQLKSSSQKIEHLNLYNYFQRDLEDVFNKDYTALMKNRDVLKQTFCNSSVIQDTYNQIFNFINQEYIEFERVDSVVTNRRLNLKFRTPTIKEGLLTHPFNIPAMKNNPYQLQNFVFHYVNTKSCAWSAKEALDIDNLLRMSAQGILIFGHSLFNQNWLERKAFNYVNTYDSLLRNEYNFNNTGDKISYCLEQKQELQNILDSFLKKPPLIAK